MNDIPDSTFPEYSEESCDDALFHYTSANGLIGILDSGCMWGTAFYCANDESELVTGRGILSPMFSLHTHGLIQANDLRVQTFRNRGVDVREYARNFENRIIQTALYDLTAYITCFYKARNQEDFGHGLLSQWRGYGTDGGYALQFSKKKLQAAISAATENNDLNYQLLDVHYSNENPYKSAVLAHSEAFLGAYNAFLDDLASEPLFKRTRPSPIATLGGGPLESLIEYLVHTKNKHFVEERECRLSVVDAVNPEFTPLTAHYFNRNGLIIPYKKTPDDFKILDCIDWIIVGPGPRMSARYKSVREMIRQKRLSIEVRPSHIPFTRF